VGTGGLGDFRPPAGSRGGAPVEVWGRPQKPDIYKQFDIDLATEFNHIKDWVARIASPEN